MDDYIDKLLLGDCLEIMPQLPDHIFDLIIIDPPNILLAKHFALRIHVRRTFGDLGVSEFFFKTFFKELERVIKPTGTFYIFCSESSYPFFWYYSYPFTKKIRLLTWDKKVSINGFHWRHQSEQILFGLMPNTKKVPTGDGDVIPIRGISVKERLHPAQKPNELLEKLILKSSQENDLVGDFFAGSGSTLICAKNLKRKYFGIEYDNNYYEIALNLLKKRKKNEIQQKIIDEI